MLKTTEVLALVHSIARNEPSYADLILASEHLWSLSSTPGLLEEDGASGME